MTRVFLVLRATLEKFNRLFDVKSNVKLQHLDPFKPK